MKRTSLLLLSGLWVLLFSWLAPNGLAQSIAAGTDIRIRLQERLDTAEAKEGQVFSATLAEPVRLNGANVLPRGTQVRGEVTETVSPGRLNRPASITLVLTRVDKTPIQTEMLQIDGKSHVVRNSGMTGGGAATETAFVAGKQEIVLPSETELDFVVADAHHDATRSPDPVVARSRDGAPESKPAIWHDPSHADNDDAFDALILSDRDKWLIHSYFKSNYGNLPPALSKRGGDLPPGLEKRLRPDEALPPGIQSRVEPLPAELERQLPRLPFGYSRVFLSGRVLVLADDGQIVDLMFVYR